MRIVPNIISQFFVKDEQLESLQNILGFKPSKIALYEQALVHSSNQDETKENNERLEYLGDAILSAIVGEYLFKKYPRQPEGFLTEMRSKIVNRKSLNDIALKIGLKKMVKYKRNDQYLKTSQIFGNALEALIGAIYIDKGYTKTKQFIQKQILTVYIDMDALEEEESNYKNKLIGWANRNKKQVEFVLLKEVKESNNRRLFTIGIKLEEDIIVEATAVNKKEASKQAAQKAVEKLEL